MTPPLASAPPEPRPRAAPSRRGAARLLRAGPWCDAAGRLSALRIATLLLLLYPAAWMIGWWQAGVWLVPQGDLTYWSGVWALAVLLASLAVTPLRRLAGWGRLLQVRRMVGVAALLYALAHLAIFGWLRAWDWLAVLRESATRPSLLLAAASLALLAALGLTSTDGAIRRLGAAAWGRLHRWTHAAAALALAHFLLSPGSYGGLPFLALGGWAWLMGWRLLDRRGAGRDAGALLALALGCFALTVGAEAALPALLLGTDPWTTLSLNLSLDLGLAPGWQVLGAGLALALLPALRPR